MEHMKTFTLVFVNNGVIDYETFSDVEALRERLLECAEDDNKIAVFKSEPVPFKICREPTVTIGLRRGRKAATATAVAAVKPAVKRGRPRRAPSNGAKQQDLA